MLDGDERLMLQIIDAEESYMTEWLEAQRGVMEAQIKDIDHLRATSKSLLQESNELRFLQVGLLHLVMTLFLISRKLYVQCLVYAVVHYLFIFNSKLQRKNSGEYFQNIFSCSLT